MVLLTKEAEAYVGLESDLQTACDVVERGAVRRYSQAIMDHDPAYSVGAERFGGPVAPPIFPTHMFRRDYGTPDAIQENARNPDFDGLGAAAGKGLPPIEPLAHLSLLNGGSELEFFRHARHGETVTVKSRYASIEEKQTSKGSIVLVVIEEDYFAGADLLVRARRTQIRR
jgi:hypothetical protein